MGYPKFVKWRNIGEIPEESYLYWDGVLNYDNEDGATSHTRINQIVTTGLYRPKEKLMGEEWFRKIYVDYTQNFLKYTGTWFPYGEETIVIPQAGFCGTDHSVPLHRDTVFEPVDPILLALTDMKLFVHDTTYDINRGDVFSLATNLQHNVPKQDYDQQWVGARFITQKGKYNITHLLEELEYEELSEITYTART
jgi:hypothetical protein